MNWFDPHGRLKAIVDITGVMPEMKTHPAAIQIPSIYGGFAGHWDGFVFVADPDAAHEPESEPVELMQKNA